MTGFDFRVKRVSTGVTGLKQLLNGRLTSGRIENVCGPDGTGSMTLEMKWLAEGRKNGDACLYITLLESAAELRSRSLVHTVAQALDVAMRWEGRQR